ncbi:MAG: hypothetical protein FWF23_02410 [Alphaproteobacteria bacterium]|nr:hypothetical protein [Alphaproteobacteria bacterium]MCL2505836.1 hypothetical protein [Alphaproteobacteria bacterium]
MKRFLFTVFMFVIFVFCSQEAFAQQRVPQQAQQRVHGVCGAANELSSHIAPTANLCASGIPSRVNGVGPWVWSCAGMYGGRTDSCITHVKNAADGVCGDANGGNYPGAVPPNLCRVGNAIEVASTHTEWSWRCSGTDGGRDSPVCSATRFCYTVVTSCLGAYHDSALSCSGIPNPYRQDITLNYAIAGGAGGTGFGGSGGSSALLVYRGDTLYGYHIAKGGDRTANASYVDISQHGERIPASGNPSDSGPVTFYGDAVLQAYAGGGGAYFGGGGAGFFGGAGGCQGNSTGGSYEGGLPFEPAWDTAGAAFKGGDCNGTPEVRAYGAALGGSGLSGGTLDADVQGGGGGGFGSGGGAYGYASGAKGGSSGSNGHNSNVYKGGLGANNWISAVALPDAAGRPSENIYNGANAGLIIIRYSPPDGVCRL